MTVGNDACGGGLSGYGTGWDSFASGAVTGGDRSAVGGLVCEGSSIRSYATGAVTGGSTSEVGGLAGRDTNGIIDSYATAKAFGGTGARVGSLVGSLLYDDNLKVGSIYRAYAKCEAGSGDAAEVGGLVGYKDFRAPVEQAYSLANVSGGKKASIGGFVAYDAATHHHKNNHIAFAYWDLDASGIGDPSQGAGNIPNDPGITGLTDAQLKSGLPPGFDPQSWGQNPNINNGYPYLLANPPPKGNKAIKQRKASAAHPH